MVPSTNTTFEADFQMVAPWPVTIHGQLPRGELVAMPGVRHAPTQVEPVVLAALARLLGDNS